MAIREIIQGPDDRLLQPSAPVGELTADVRRVIDDLIDTRYLGRGAALAAVQIGEHIRVVVTDPKLFYGFKGMINPEIINRGKQIVEALEGCMSIRHGRLRFKVKRNQVVTIKFRGLDGGEHTIVAKGMPARLAQHEIDHLDGKLIA